MYEIIAMLTMLIDHLGVVFFPEQEWLRIIGRLAMPLYTYGIVQGYKYTGNFKKYLLRLFILAVTGQVFYTMLFHKITPNIIFTFIVCLLLMKYFQTTKDGPFLKYFIILNGALFLQILQFSYGTYAFILMLLYYHNKSIILGHILLNAVGYFVNGWALQFYSFIASVIIKYLPNHRLIGRARLFYQLFYPAHLAVLLLISKLIQ